MDIDAYNVLFDRHVASIEEWNGPLSDNFKKIMREYGWFILTLTEDGAMWEWGTYEASKLNAIKKKKS